MEYLSKDVDYMVRLKEATYHGAQEYNPKQRDAVWESVRKQVTMEDLRRHAVTKFGRPVLFPAMGCHRPIVVIFNLPAMDEELENLYKMTDKLRIPREQIYVTHFNKVATESEEEVEQLKVLMKAELNIVKPRFVITYGQPIGNTPHTVVDLNGTKLMDTVSLQFGDDEEAAKSQKLMAWNNTRALFTGQ